MSPAQRQRCRPPSGAFAAPAVLLWLVSCASANREPKPTRPAEAVYVERGLASWYGEKFHGRKTANGERFDMLRVSAAHKTLPFGSLVRVTNLENGRQLKVRINDRGPFIAGRILDLSKAAARKLGMLRAGVVQIELRVISMPPGSAPAAAQRFIVQLGAFRQPQRAQKLAARVSKREPGVRVYAADGWHRVQVRGLESREEAVALRSRLKALGVQAVVLPD